MMNDYTAIDIAFKNLMSSLAKLRDLRVLTNKKDLTCQIGEWLVAQLYDGERAFSSIQKYWDIKVEEKRLQVKAHAKAATTPARWSPIKYNENAGIDELVIVIFSPDYKLKEFYKLAWQQALPLIRRQKDRDVINWDDLREFKIPFGDLPKQDIVSLFR